MSLYKSRFKKLVLFKKKTVLVTILYIYKKILHKRLQNVYKCVCVCIIVLYIYIYIYIYIIISTEKYVEYYK